MTTRCADINPTVISGVRSTGRWEALCEDLQQHAIKDAKTLREDSQWWPGKVFNLTDALLSLHIFQHFLKVARTEFGPEVLVATMAPTSQALKHPTSKNVNERICSPEVIQKGSKSRCCHDPVLAHRQRPQSTWSTACLFKQPGHS